MKKMLKKGNGWRIGWRENATVYKGLIGADDWAIELTAEEMQDFHRLVKQIADNMEQMQEHLMAEEKISCEVESELIWLGAEGYWHNYSLRVIINQNRSFEGNWSALAVPEMINACQSLNFSKVNSD